MTDFAYKNLWGRLELLTKKSITFTPEGHDKPVSIPLSDIPTRLRPTVLDMGEKMFLPVKHSTYWKLI